MEIDSTCLTGFEPRVMHKFIGGLSRYLEHVEPGSFLRAVLENDLLAASQRGDAESIRDLPALLAMVQRLVPDDAHGSRERVAAWLRHDESEPSKKLYRINFTYTAKCSINYEAESEADARLLFHEDDRIQEVAMADIDPDIEIENIEVVTGIIYTIDVEAGYIDPKKPDTIVLQINDPIPEEYDFVLWQIWRTAPGNPTELVTTFETRDEAEGYVEALKAFDNGTGPRPG